MKGQSSGAHWGGERRLGEPTRDGGVRGQVDKEASLFIFFPLSSLFILLSYCDIVISNKKDVFDLGVLIMAAPKSPGISQSRKPLRCK